MFQTNLTKLYPKKGCPKVRKMRPPLLKQQLLDQLNVVQWLASRGVILAESKSEKKQSKVKFFLYIFRIWLQFQNDFSSNASGSLKTLGMVLGEVKGQRDVTLYSAQLTVWLADIIELNNGGKPNVEITLEIIELSIGITT